MTCPYCARESTFLFPATDLNQRSSAASFNYRRCRACDLTFIDPIPADLSQFYLNEQYGIPAAGEDFGPRSDSQRWKVEIAKSLVAPCPLLEIGPATGEFALAARKAGYAPKLLEMDTECCRFLRDTLGMDVVQTTEPAKYLESSASYNAICSWQAIEHIPDFWTLMERAAARLTAGGVLVLSTPNPASLQARLLGRWWPHLDAPRHLYLIPPAWMHAFARKHGLQVVLDTTRDTGSLALNGYGWYLAVRNALRDRASEKTVEFVAAKLATLFGPFEAREGWGCSYTVAFRR